MVIIVSTLAITCNPSQKVRHNLNKKIIVFGLLVAIIDGVYYYLFDVSTKTYGYPSTALMFQIGLIITGVLLYLQPKYRRAFNKVVMNGGRRFFGLNIFNEMIFSTGELLLNYAVIFISLAVVNVVSGLQTTFVILIGIIATKLLPRVFNKKMTKKDILFKLTRSFLGCIGLSVIFL